MVPTNTDPISDLTAHERRERDISEATRQAVLERDNGQCQACGQAGDNRLQLHHVIYRSQGGSHDEENLVTLCFDCHKDVHDGLLRLAFIEWRPGDYSWFCARVQLPRRWL